MMTPFTGHLLLRAVRRPQGRTVLSEQSFRAPFHLSKPYWDNDAGVLLTQVVNPTAGVLSGDCLESNVAVDDGAALVLTTPSATRIFSMRSGEAICRQHFTVAAGGWLEVSPEPLVPHHGASYRQTTTVDIASGGALLLIDQLVPGRIAHGETWAWSRLRLELDVRLDSQLILRERLEQSGEELRALAALAGSGPSACMATAVLIPADIKASETPWLSELAALHGNGIWVGVSTLQSAGWSIKVVARDSLQLRATIDRLRRILAVHFPRLGWIARKS